MYPSRPFHATGPWILALVWNGSTWRKARKIMPPQQQHLKRRSEDLDTICTFQSSCRLRHAHSVSFPFPWGDLIVSEHGKKDFIAAIIHLDTLTRGAVVAERLEPRTSIPEVPGSSPGPAVAPLGKALYPHCLVFRRRLQAVGPVYRREIPYARKRTHFTSRKE